MPAQKELLVIVSTYMQHPKRRNLLQIDLWSIFCQCQIFMISWHASNQTLLPDDLRKATCRSHSCGSTTHTMHIHTRRITKVKISIQRSQIDNMTKLQYEAESALMTELRESDAMQSDALLGICPCALMHGCTQGQTWVDT